MREIKFRAWHPELKEMYWFDLMWGNTWQEGAGYIGMIPFGKDIERKGFCRDNKELVSPNEVKIMQYTDLKDKNSKEIFEGDIVKLKSIVPRGDGTYDDDLFEVRYNMAHWEVHNNSAVITEWLEGVFADCEVIGNIYENPDLLDQ